MDPSIQNAPVGYYSYGSKQILVIFYLQYPDSLDVYWRNWTNSFKMVSKVYPWFQSRYGYKNLQTFEKTWCEDASIISQKMTEDYHKRQNGI